MSSISWLAGSSGNWSQASNWSTDTVPESGDNVTINAIGTYTVTVDGFDPVNILVFDAPAATIAVASSYLLEVSGATIAGGKIDGPGRLWTGGVTSVTGQPLTIGGGLVWTNNASNSSNAGTVNDSVAINVGDAAGLAATIQDNGVFNLTTDAAGLALGQVNIGGTLQSGDASFNVGQGGTLAKTGGAGTSYVFANVSEAYLSTISVSDGTLEFDGSNNSFSGNISGTGTIAFGAGTEQVVVTPTVSNLLIDGGSVSFSGNLDNTYGKTLDYLGNLTETAGVLNIAGVAPMIAGIFVMKGGTLNLDGDATLTLGGSVSFAGGTITGGNVALNKTTAVTGSTLIEAAVANNGSIAVDTGTLDLDAAVSGNGQIAIGAGTELELGQASATTQQVIFTGMTGQLKLVQPAAFQSPISGFKTGNIIDFAGLKATGALDSRRDLTLFNGTTTVAQLTVSTPYSRNVIHVSPDGSGGTFVTVSQPPPTPTARDFNGDGKSDILWQNTDGQAAVWLMNGATPTNEALVGGNPGPSWNVIGSGDFNGDGKADILWQNTDGQAAVWLMNGTTPTSEPLVGGNPGASWHAIGTGDFNGDGKSDILWQNTDGQAAIWLMNGTTETSGPLVGGNPGASWHVVGTGDFNGDGQSDILWQNTDGQAAIWLMNGATPTVEAVVGNNPGASWRLVGSGDFTGNGISDLLWQNTDGQAAIWLMNGTTPTTEALVGGNPGPNWHVVGTGDFNGDGKSDILWQNTDGQAAVWLMNGTTPTSEPLVAQNPGASWHIPFGS